MTSSYSYRSKAVHWRLFETHVQDRCLTSTYSVAELDLTSVFVGTSSVELSDISFCVVQQLLYSYFIIISAAITEEFPTCGMNKVF